MGDRKDWTWTREAVLERGTAQTAERKWNCTDSHRQLLPRPSLSFVSSTLLLFARRLTVASPTRPLNLPAISFLKFSAPVKSHFYIYVCLFTSMLRIVVLSCSFLCASFLHAIFLSVAGNYERVFETPTSSQARGLQKNTFSLWISFISKWYSKFCSISNFSFIVWICLSDFHFNRQTSRWKNKSPIVKQALRSRGRPSLDL